MKRAQNSDSKTSKKELLEQISAKNPYVTFFLGHPVHMYRMYHYTYIYPSDVKLHAKGEIKHQV